MARWCGRIRSAFNSISSRSVWTNRLLSTKYRVGTTGNAHKILQREMGLEASMPDSRTCHHSQVRHPVLATLKSNQKSLKQIPAHESVRSSRGHLMCRPLAHSWRERSLSARRPPRCMSALTIFVTLQAPLE